MRLEIQEDQPPTDGPRPWQQPRDLDLEPRGQVSSGQEASHALLGDRMETGEAGCVSDAMGGGTEAFSGRLFSSLGVWGSGARRCGKGGWFAIAAKSRRADEGWAAGGPWEVCDGVFHTEAGRSGLGHTGALLGGCGRRQQREERLRSCDGVFAKNLRAKDFTPLVR